MIMVVLLYVNTVYIYMYSALYILTLSTVICTTVQHDCSFQEVTLLYSICLCFFVLCVFQPTVLCNFQYHTVENFKKRMFIRCVLRSAYMAHLTKFKSTVSYGQCLYSAKSHHSLGRCV